MTVTLKKASKVKVDVDVDERPEAGQLPAEPNEADRLSIAAEAVENAKIAAAIAEETEKLEKKARASKKFGHLVEISVRAVGMVPAPAKVVDIDSLNAAERSVVLDDLIDELKDQLL